MANEKRLYLIDRSELSKEIAKIGVVSVGNVLQCLSDAPTVDAVEVVRCKDCKHFTEGMAIGMCKRNPEKPILPLPYDGFCSFGESRGLE